MECSLCVQAGDTRFDYADLTMHELLPRPL